jgi:hypothetical protein
MGWKQLESKSMQMWEHVASKDYSLRVSIECLTTAAQSYNATVSTNTTTTTCN